MKDQRILLLAVLATAVSTAAADQVRLVAGGAKNGGVLSTSRDGVKVDVVDGTTNVPVDAIRFIILDDEPSQLTQARINFENGGYETTLDLIDELADERGLSDLVQQEIAFYQAASSAKLAINGDGDAQDAGRRLVEFIRGNGDSFHYYDVVQLLGDLRVSLGQFDQAERTYAQIAKSPSLTLKARAALLAGKMLQAQGNHEDAIKRFDALIGAGSNDPGVVRSKRVAELAKAVSLAATGDLDGGLELARAAVRRAGNSDAAGSAAAYNTLGRCYEEADRPMDALFAYLHTDLLFNDDPATHAEALAHLANLWKAAGKPDAARDAQSRLNRRYAASSAARGAG